MSEWSESDSSYIRGRIDGYLHAIARHSDTDKQFDSAQWEDLYGTRVIYDIFPAWTGTEARDRGEDPITLCDWDHATDTKSLKHGVDLPLDRSGNIVFEDGTVVMVTSGTPLMFTLGEELIVEKWGERGVQRSIGASGFDFERVPRELREEVPGTAPEDVGAPVCEYFVECSPVSAGPVIIESDIGANDR